MKISRLIASGILGGGVSLPAPAEFSDAFARADGAIGNDWTGATWTMYTQTMPDLLQWQTHGKQY